MAVLERQCVFQHQIQRWNILYKERMWHCRREMHVQIHQEMRRYREPEAFRGVRDFHPFGDTADAHCIRLQDIRRSLRNVFLKNILIVKRLADSNGNSRLLAQDDMAVHIVRLNGLLKPEEPGIFHATSELDCLAGVPFHIGIYHQIGLFADCLPDSMHARHVFEETIAPYLYLDTFEALRHKCHGLPDELVFRKVEPAAIGIVNRHRLPRAAEELIERQFGALRHQIPQGDIHCRHP